MSAGLGEQGLVAAQLAGLRRHGLSTPAALRLVLPSLRGSLAREAESLVATLERGAVPAPSASPLFALLAQDGDANAEALWEVARGYATAAEAELAWAQVSRPWVLGGAGLLLLLCGIGWAFQSLPGHGGAAIGVAAAAWSILGVMRWLGVPLAVLWFLSARAASLPLRSSIERPFLLAASLYGLAAGSRGPTGGPGRIVAGADADALWTPMEWRAFQLLRTRHGEGVAARALASEFERQGRLAAARTAALSALVCLVCGLSLLGLLAMVLAMPIFTIAGRVQ